MPDSEGDGRYDYTRPWELTSQTLEMQRRQEADMAPQWYPAVVPSPDPYEMLPPMYGYRTEELNITDILDGVSSRLRRLACPRFPAIRPVRPAGLLRGNNAPDRDGRWRRNIKACHNEFEREGEQCLSRAV